MNLPEFMDRHARVALMFSAGKDSAACLRLCTPWLEQLTVLWCNPGRPYPEVRAYMDAVKSTVPRFIEVKGNQPEWVRTHGHPVDMLPWEATPTGRQCLHAGPDGVRLSLAHECRNANMWQPALEALRQLDCTGVIRGEKLTDRPLALPLDSHFEGREYFRPLLHWTDQEVYDFIGDALPPGYRDGLSGSLDCMDCTAFLARNPQRLMYLRRWHPKVFHEIVPVLGYMREATRAHLDRLEEL